MAEVAKGIIDIEINTGSAASTLQALQSQINAFNLALNKANATQGKFSAEYVKKLQDAINKTSLFTAETMRLETAAATLDKTLSKGKTSLGQYFSARFNKDGAIAAETMALASERAKRLQTQFIATSAAANGFQDVLAVRPLAAFSSELAVAGQRAEIMSAMFKQGTTQLINFGKNVQWAGRQLMVGFTVPLTIFGAVAGKTFMELEKQAVAFKKVYGDIFTTPAELNQNLEAVKGLAAEYTKYGIAVKDTIGLAAQAAAAGRKNADLTDAVSQATRLATLGQMDQNAALETTISLQSAFRLSGQDLADTINFLNMVENQTVVSLQDIAAAIPRVAPVIQGLGGDVKDLTVFLAAMQEGGVDAAEGANALKSGLASLINPTRQATEMLSGMGINLQSIIEANKGDLMATVRSFAEALQGLDQFSRQQALEQVFGKFQYAKLGALFDNISRKGSQAQQVIATMGYTTEQLGATADKELKTIEESFGVQLTGAIERFKLAIAPIGEIFVKIAIPLVNFATSVAKAFNGLSDGQKKFAAIGAVVIGVVVPAVTMLTGLFLNLVGTLAKMTQGITLFGMGFIKGGPLGAVKALTQSSKYLSLAEMDAAMAAQQLAGANQALNATLVEQVGSSNAAAAAIGNLTKAYSAMIATQGAAAARFPEHFGIAGAAGTKVKVSQVAMRGVQKRNSGGPIFMSNGTTVPGTGNTDTVPAMLTPGEFVVNKEATKNNLGLLHSINNSKNPQGLNAGRKARGMQYLMAGQLVRGMFDNIPGGFASLGSQVARGVATTVARKSGSLVRLPRSFANQIRTKRKLERAGFGGARTPYIPGTRSGSGNKPAIGPAPGVRGYNPYSEDDISRIIGPEFDNFGGSKARSALFSKLFAKPGQQNSSYLFGHAGSPEYYEHARRLGLEMPEGRRAYPRGTVSQLEEKLFNFSNTDIERNLILDVLPKTGAVIPRVTNTPMSRGIGASKNLFGNPQWYDELELIEFLKKQEVPVKKIREIAGRVASNKKKLIPEYDTITEVQWGRIQQEAEDAAFLYLNAGGQVPGMQYFAANNRQRVVQEASRRISGSLRRRVRPGRDQRFSQQAVLKDYVHDAKFIRNSKDPEDMNTLLSMMKPLTQQTRATRGTVLGSTNNPELPYAQQKRIVAAIKEGRYEDLFGMRLNFRGPGSYTTRRETDFSPFIGDLSNPTLRAFSDGFMTLKSQKEEIAKFKKIMRTARVKKLTPGTAEYARVLAQSGWSPAAAWRPGPNPVIGSDWTFEQVLANRLRDYNNRKKGLKKAFPDKKIQQLLIDEMVGSGALAIDVPRAFYKHPRLPYRGNHIENLVKKENEILLGDRTSQITGVATDLKTRLPSIITKSGVLEYNKGGMIPGVQYLNAGTQVLKLLQNQKQFGFMSNPSNPFTFDAAFLTGAKGNNPVGTWARTLGGTRNPKDTLEFLFSNDETKSTVLPMIGAMLVNARSKGVSGLSPSTSLSADSSSLVKKLQDRGILGREYSSEITNAYDKADAGSQISRAVYSVTGAMDSGTPIGNYHALLPKDLDTFGEIARMLLRSKGRENISQEEATIIMNEIIKRGTLDDFLKSESSFNNLLLNSGNIVPGIGNTDTVPAMLTPGEFVVNKEATKNNLGLLHQINNSQKLNKGGIAGVQYFGVGGMIAGLAPIAAGLGASMLPMVMAPEMGMFGQVAASTAAFVVAQKSVQAVLMKFQKVSLKAVDSTGEVGEGFKKLFPQLSKLSPNILKFALPMASAGTILAAVGFTLYKLNKNLTNVEKSGAELSDAMYGSAKTTKAMGDAFGRETFATAARRKAAEKSGGQEISQEAVAASGEFMKSDAAKGILEDIKLVQNSGEDAVLALRNQLASSIISGVISPEEAKAIALDIGKELGSATLGVQVSGELTSLIGPNGERISNNLIEIIGQITPKIDSEKIKKGAQDAFDSLNPGEKFVQFFKGGKESFVKEFSIDQISAANASALAKEAEARALLNLSYQEGIITLKEYLDQESKITSGANKRSSFIDNANAQALGFASTAAMESKLQEQLANLNVDTTGMSTLEASQAVALGEARAREDSKGKAAYEAIVTKSKESLKESFINSGMDADIAKTMTDSMEEGVAQIDPGIFDKFLSGQIPLEGYNILMNLESSGNLTLEDVERLGKELTALTTIPKIDKIINFETANEEMVTEIYDAYLALKEEPEIFKGISIKDGAHLALDTMNQFGINYEWIMSLPDEEKIITLTIIENHVKLRQAAVAGDRGDRLALGASNAEMAKLREQTDLLTPSPVTDKTDKSGGVSNKFDELKKMLMERFKLQEMLIDKEAEGFNNRVKQLNREIELEERQVRLRQKGLDELSKKEEAVNKSYEQRVEALDKVSESNSRIAEQEKSRISLASALASGDIAAAATAAGEMQQQSAQYQIEDTRAALEQQKQKDLDSLTISINGKLMTRKGIESEIETIQNRMYDKGIEIQGLQDSLLKIEDRKLALTKEREQVETRMYLLEQRKAIQDLTKGKGGKLSKADKEAIADYKSAYNQVVEMYNASNPGAKVQKVNYGGMMRKMAFGGVSYKGSTEAPPPLKMYAGSTVPGTGITDKVPALLTPGEFVVRKSVADTNRGFLEALNGQVFPGIGGAEGVPTNNFLNGIGSPRYSIPESSVPNIQTGSASVVAPSSTMYNSTYNVNVNVSGTNASPDDIANVVMAKLSQQNRGSLRSTRY